jgi:hypothetical protein
VVHLCYSLQSGIIVFVSAYGLVGARDMCLSPDVALFALVRLGNVSELDGESFAEHVGHWIGASRIRCFGSEQGRLGDGSLSCDLVVEFIERRPGREWMEFLRFGLPQDRVKHMDIMVSRECYPPHFSAELAVWEAEVATSGGRLFGTSVCTRRCDELSVRRPVLVNGQVVVERL